MGSGAAGQNLGYRIQDWRVLSHLLDSSSSLLVCLEDMDDVHLELIDGKYVLEQSKSALTGNPLSNRSKDLWKTFYNWVKLGVEDAVVVSECSFVLFTLQQFTGSIADDLHKANTKSEIDSVVLKITGLRSEDPNKVDDYLTYILDRVEILEEIIANFSIETWSGDPDLAVYQKFESHPIRPEHYEFLLRALLGFVHHELTNKINNSEVAAIRKPDFSAHYIKVRDTLNPIMPWPDRGGPHWLDS